MNLKELVRRNFGLKLLSLVLAVVIWATVVARSPGVRRFQVPIEFEEGPNRIVTSYEPSLLDVRLSGDATMRERISGEGIYAEVSVKQLQPGQHRLVTVVPTELRQIPRGVSNIEIINPQIRIDLDRREKKLVDVKLDRVGSPPEGFRIANVNVEPSEVEADGPARLLKTVESIRTEIVSVNARRSAFSSLVKLVPPDRHVRLEPSSVRVSVNIVETQVSRSIDVPVVSSEGEWTFEPARVEVSFEVPPSLLARVREQVVARAYTEDLPAAGAEVPVVLDWGELDNAQIARIRNLEISPGRVTAVPATDEEAP
jgi:YbbR domain-containing protein